MPYERKSRNAKRRRWPRKGRKRVFRKRRAPPAARLPGMLGTRFMAKLRYCDQLVLLAPGVAGTSRVHSFRANSLYDPDYTGTGHQPIGFDQYMQFYNHYTVVGAKITATFVSGGTSASTNTMVCGIELSGDASPTSALNDIFEQGRSRYKIVTNSSASQTVTVTHNLSVKKFLAQKPLAEDANAGTNASNPQELIYFHVWTAPLDSSLLQSDCRVNLKIDFIAVFHEAKPLPGS